MQVSIYIPTEDKNAEVIPTDIRERNLQWVVGRMIDEFGGVTSTESIGYWKNQREEVMQEEVTILHSFVSAKATNVLVEFMENLASVIKINTNQECVLYTVNDQHFFYNG